MLLLQHAWTNLGMIQYAIEAFPSAIHSFRQALRLSSDPVSGRIMNNLACANAEMKKYSLAHSELVKSLRIQKSWQSASFDTDTSAGEDLLSIACAIFNVGFVCAQQRKYIDAICHIEACLAVRV